mgnify:CR=1 FL=1
MPWQEVSKVEERLRFVARLLDGEGMSAVCREFGISRKTGDKIWNRYQRHDMEALCERLRRPCRHFTTPKYISSALAMTARLSSSTLNPEIYLRTPYCMIPPCISQTVSSSSRET